MYRMVDGNGMKGAIEKKKFIYYLGEIKKNKENENYEKSI